MKQNWRTGRTNKSSMDVMKLVAVFFRSFRFIVDLNEGAAETAAGDV
jgi:hypothetical protein